MADVDIMTVEQLKAEVLRLRKQLGAARRVAESDDDEDEMDEMPGAPAPAPADGALVDDPDMDGPTMADVKDRKIVEDMYAAGSMTEDDYDEMVARLEEEREDAARELMQAAAWKEVCTIFADKGAKKGVVALEKDWNSLNLDEPYSAVAVARCFLQKSGPGPTEIPKGEVGEFLAGGKPFMQV